MVDIYEAPGIDGELVVKMLMVGNNGCESTTV